MADYLESEKVRQRWLRYLETGHKEPAERMMATYKRTLRTIEDEVKPLIRRLAAANRTGDASEVAALSTRLSLAYSRAESVRQAITSTIERSGLAQVTNEQITKLAPKAFAEGAALGYERLKGAGVDFQRINSVAVEQAVGRLRRGTNAYEWVQAFAGAQGKDAARSLARSVALGHGVERMTREFSRSLSGAGAHRIETFVRTEMIGAMREGNLTTYRANRDLVQGWVWNATASACAVCQGMNGSVHGLDEMMFSHPRCRCSADPITKPFSELGAAGVEDTASTGFDPNGPFSLLADSEQRRILGPGRFRRYKDGGLDLRDIPARTNHPRWGPGLRSKTLAELDRGGLERVPVTPAGVSKPSPSLPSVVDTTPAPPPRESPLPWLDELQAIRSRRESYGIEPNLRYGMDDEALKVLDGQVDDVLEAGAVIEREVARRVKASGSGEISPDFIEALEDRLRGWKQRVEGIERMPRYEGKTSDLREARINLRITQSRLDQARAGNPSDIRDALQSVLRELGDTGFGSSGLARLVDVAERAADQVALESVARMGDYLPTEWLGKMLAYMEDVRERTGHRMQFKRTSRGEFSRGGIRRAPHLHTSNYSTMANFGARVEGGAYDSTTLHEMTHWAEAALPEMRELEWAYYRRRTTVNGEREQRKGMQTLQPGRGYGADEVAREDQFTDPYIGKDYGDRPDSFYEIMTMGIESAFRTGNGAIDEDHRRFVYGLLALLRSAA